MKKLFRLFVFLLVASAVTVRAQGMDHVATPKEVRGLYVTLDTFQDRRMLDSIIEICKRTSINTLVIDVRSNGVNAFVIKNEKARKRLEQLHAMNLYLVGRMIVFWRPNGWFDPGSQRRWDEIARASKLAINLGFDEINYDYVRYGGPHEPKSPTPMEQRTPIIRDFCRFLKREVGDKTGRPISVDFFGVTFLKPEPGVGQRIEDSIDNFNYVMPMAYPSHWSPGTFGVKDPGRAPYEMVYKSLTAGWKRVANDPNRKAQLRPWLQAFGLDSIYPMKFMSYTAKDVAEQIRACHDAGCVGWVLWNPSSKYSQYEQAIK